MNFKSFLKIVLVIGIVAGQFSNSFGQAVSINSTGAAPHANAILDVSTTGAQGVLLARMTTATRTGWAPTTSGVTVYDTNTESYWYWDDTTNVWREIPNTAGIVTTLDGSYDGGTSGSGAGRIIVADAGAVDIQGSGGLIVAGNIGVGVGTASYELDVAGEINLTDALRVAGDAGTAGQALFSSGGGAMTWQTISSDEIVDADGDTKIQVEESADEDFIRFDTFGSERMVITKTGEVGIGTTTPDASYALTALNGAGPTIKVGSTTLGLLVEANAAAEDGISAIHSSGANGSAYYAVRGEVTNESGVGYLGYHTSTDDSYAVYGQSGTYAGYFDGDVNLTGELQLNGSAGTSGQVIVSQGTGVDPIWGAAGVQSVTAGDALLNSGTASAVVLDVEANNGLNVDVPNNKVQLGGDLTEATEIQLETFDLTLDLNGTGEFVVQDANVDHFKIGNNGDATFGSDAYFKNTNTGGNDLVTITDAGPGGNDGRIQVFVNGTMNHVIHGDGTTIFNDQNLNRDFIVNASGTTNMLYVDASASSVGIGVSTPSQTLDVDGSIRMRGGTTTSGFVPVSSGDGTMVWTDPASLGLDITTASNGLNEVSDDIRLGGALIQNTTVSQGAFTMDFTSNAVDGFSVDGATFSVDASNNRIGVGTAAPDYELDVAGDIGTDNRLYHNGDANTFIEFTPDRIQLFAGSGASSWIDIQNSASEVAINENSLNRDFRVEGGTEINLLFVDGSADFIGVATSAPTTELDVNGQIRMRTGATNGYVPVGDANGVMTWTDPATLGLDITTASNGLTEVANDIQLGGALTQNTTVAQGAFTLDFTSTAVDGFSVDGTTLSVDGSNNRVGIGTSTPDANLNVGDASGGIILISREATATIGQTLGSLYFDAESTSVSTTDAPAAIRGLASEGTMGNSNKGGHLTFLTKADGSGLATAASERMRITSDGNVGIGVTNPTVKFQVVGDATISGKFNSNGIQESSDKRFKKNITPLENALSKVLKLEGVSYDWRVNEFPNRKFGDRTEIGVIAQDVEKVIPELVSTDAEGFKAVQYSHMVPLLIEAMKEQQEQIEALKKQAEDSESRYGDLKRYLSEIENRNK